MSLSRLLNQPLVIVTRTASDVDEYHKQTWTETRTQAVGYVERSSSSEALTDRDVASSSWRAYLPTGTVLESTSLIECASGTFEVRGVPEAVWNPRTRRISHVRVDLTAMGEVPHG